MDSARNRAHAALLILVVQLLAAPGCATYRQATLPGTVSGSVLPNNEQSVGEGAHVKVKLRSGDVFEGVVDSISGDELNLRELGNYGLSSYIIKFSEIENVCVRNEESGTIERRWFAWMFFVATVAFAASLPILEYGS